MGNVLLQTVPRKLYLDTRPETIYIMLNTTYCGVINDSFMFIITALYRTKTREYGSQHQVPSSVALIIIITGISYQKYIYMRQKCFIISNVKCYSLVN